MASTGTTQRQQASPPAGEKQPDGEPLPQANPLAALESGFWVLAILLTLVAVYFICMTPLAIADFWWQAKAGELIVKQGRVPTRDPFSWTAQGQPWLVHEWLPDVFFYLAYSNRLQWLLLFYKSGMAALACGLVIARTWTRTRSIPLGIAAALATASVMRNFTDIRPQMVTFVLLAALLLALDEYRVGRLARLPWMLPVLFALWANLHGGVVVGLLIVLIWAAGEAGGKWLFGQDSHGLVPLSVSLAAACVAVGLNPNGFHVYTYPLQVLGHPAVTDYIREWFSPDFHLPYMRPFEIMLLGTLGILALTRVRHYGELLVLLAMAHAALITQRNTVPYAVAAGPALAAGVYFLLQESPALGRLRDWACRPWVRTVGAAAAACALAALIYQCVPRIPPGAWFDELARTASFPRHSTRLLGQGYWPGRLYNDYVWGGYLIWHLYPSRPVFIDGRAEVYYPTGAFDDEMAIHRTSPGWQDILDRRRVEVILTDRWGDLARGLVHEPQWRLAFTGEVEVVYVRTQAPRSWSRPRRSQESTQCKDLSPRGLQLGR